MDEQQAYVGPYPVDGVLGAGGFGTVYRGTDPSDGTPIAVKVLDATRLSAQHYAALRQQLAAEAAAMTLLQSRHCVRVRAVLDLPDQDAQRLSLVVSDYIAGTDLRRILRDHGTLTGPQSVGLLCGALMGLADLHGTGLVHGDIKPDNLLITADGTSLLNDFGLITPPAARGHGVPAAGTPGYMAPEQIAGDALDARSDLYGCGVMLFELLTGTRPFTGSVDDVMRDHLQHPAPDLREIDPDLGADLATVCHTALAKNPADRYPSAGDFLAALRRAATQRYGPTWGAAAGVGTIAGATIAATGTATTGIATGALGITAVPVSVTTLGAMTGGVGSMGAGSMSAGSMSAGGAGAMGAGSAMTATGTGLSGTTIGALVAGAAALAIAGGTAIAVTQNDDTDTRQQPPAAASEPAEPVEPTYIDYTVDGETASGVVVRTLSDADELNGASPEFREAVVAIVQEQLDYAEEAGATCDPTVVVQGYYDNYGIGFTSDEVCRLGAQVLIFPEDGDYAWLYSQEAYECQELEEVDYPSVLLSYNGESPATCIDYSTGDYRDYE